MLSHRALMREGHTNTRACMRECLGLVGGGWCVWESEHVPERVRGSRPDFAKVEGLLGVAPHTCMGGRGHAHNAIGPRGASMGPPSEPKHAEAVLLQGEFRKRSSGRHTLHVAPFLPKTGNHLPQHDSSLRSPLVVPGGKQWSWEGAYVRMC